MIVHLNNFKCMDTGGNCQCLYHETPQGYAIVVSNENLGIPEVFMDPMTLGVYRSLDEFSDADYIHMEDNIFLSNWHSAFNKALRAIRFDMMLTTKATLGEIHAVIVEYTLDNPKAYGHHSMQWELFNMKNQVWSTATMKGELKLILGHSDFTIHKIYR